MKSFKDLVREMRAAQRAYFDARRRGINAGAELARAKALEKKVDDIVFLGKQDLFAEDEPKPEAGEMEAFAQKLGKAAEAFLKAIGLRDTENYAVTYRNGQLYVVNISGVKIADE